MGISSDESVIYHCSNLLEELTSFTCNEWAPTTSDLLAVLVNQGMIKIKTLNSIGNK